MEAPNSIIETSSLQVSEISNYSKRLMTKANLRSKHLKGSIILGNYQNLTELDISENFIEFLDISELDNLKILCCCKNKLNDIIVNGRVLTTLVAGNNVLETIKVIPFPINLMHLDISNNRLKNLPNWIGELSKLRTLLINNNSIEKLPDNFFTNKSSILQVIQLNSNKLERLPEMPVKLIGLQEIHLQCNRLVELPEMLFKSCKNLLILNVSSNQLHVLPIIQSYVSIIERFYGTNNQFNNSALNALTALKNLRILHLAYNNLSEMPSSCSNDWQFLEELQLSGNKFTKLPDTFILMKNLKCLRLHSNQLIDLPSFVNLTTLRILDVAHNNLNDINFVAIVPKRLQLLDLSFNKKIEKTLKTLETTILPQKTMKFIDISEFNRNSLRSIEQQFNQNHLPPIHTGGGNNWMIGFSESQGYSTKLCITQLRLPSFFKNEGLFAIFDSEINYVIPTIFLKLVPKILLEERFNKETASEYMKYTLLAAQKEQIQQHIEQHNEQQIYDGLCSSSICHISTETKHNAPSPNAGNSDTILRRKFILRIASIGDTKVILITRNGGILNLTPSLSLPNINRNFNNLSIIVPNPITCEITLEDQHEFLFMANKNLFNVMDFEEIAREVKSMENVILAAKRIQDIAQSYGAFGNLSILIVKFLMFTGRNPDATQKPSLNKQFRTFSELKISDQQHFLQFQRKSVTRKSCRSTTSSNQSGGGGGGSNSLTPSSSSNTSIKSSSTTTSTNNLNQNNIYSKPYHINFYNNKRLASYNNNSSDDSDGNQQNLIGARKSLARTTDTTTAPMSDEQYKSWEYMLEKNTQLLFDKELNTISKKKNSGTGASVRTSSTLLTNRSLSLSSPQLAHNDVNHLVKHHYDSGQCHQNYGTKMPFLSKHFGSERSMHKIDTNLKSIGKNVIQPIKINGKTSDSYGTIQHHYLLDDLTLNLKEFPPTSEHSHFF